MQNRVYEQTKIKNNYCKTRIRSRIKIISVLMWRDIMNSIKAITQLEELRRDRLSFIQNSDSDEIYLNDIKAISLAVMALKSVLT